MTATQITTTSAIIPRRSGGYQVKDGKLNNAEDWIAVRPSGAFLSTVLDMAKWDAALYWAGDSACFQGHKRVFHDGGLPGFSADFERFTDDHLTVIVLCNTEGVDAGKLAVTVAGFYNKAL